MKRNKLFKMQVIVISLVLILQIFLPILSIAEDAAPSISIIKEKVGNTVNLTIKDIRAKITDIRIVYGEKITESSYFFDDERNLIEGQGENLPFTTINETDSSHEVKASFEIIDDCYEYTVFVVDEHKSSFLYNYTIEPAKENTIKINSVTSSEDNKRELTINVSDTESNISKLKIMKVSKLDETVDFKTQGTDIDISTQENKRDMTVIYTVPEDGIYKIYAENEKGSGFIWTTRVYQENPITIEWKQNEEQKDKLEIKVQDKVFDITSVKIAKYEVNKEIDWDTAIVLFSGEEEVDLEKLTYTVPESGKYSIRAEDSAGLNYKRTTSRIYINDENKPTIEAYINKSNLKDVNIVATDNMSKIKEMYVSEGEELNTLDDIRTKATELAIESGNIVEATYQIKEETTLYIYCISEDGQAFMLEAPYNAIEVRDDEEEKKDDSKTYDSYCEDDEYKFYIETHPGGTTGSELRSFYINDRVDIKRLLTFAPIDNDYVYNDKTGQWEEINPALDIVLNKLDVKSSDEKVIEVEIEEDSLEGITGIYLNCKDLGSSIITADYYYNGKHYIVQTEYWVIDKENNSDDSKPDDNKPDENKPDENKPDDNKPDDSKPDENKPDENKPDENKPDENKPDENKPDENKPDDSKPDDNKPDENKPDDNKPDENKPDENKPDENKPDDSKPDDSKPDDSKPDDNKPDDNKPDDSKPDDSKPGDSKPADSKPDNKKPTNNNQTSNNASTGSSGTATDKQNGNKTEIKDSTTSNKPLPQTGIGTGLIVAMMALMVKAIIALRKYLKVR